MKYAILGPQKGINRIADTQPLAAAIGPQATVVEIADDLAATVVAGRTAKPPVFYFLIDGALKTMQDKVAAAKAERDAALLAATTPEDKVAAAEAWIAKSFSTLILVDGLKRIMAATAAGTLASIPKTLAVATWVETVKQTALAGSVAFPPVPFTTLDVLSE